jgi:hypothetical protein
MDASNLDKATIKAIVKELLIEDQSILRSALVGLLKDQGSDQTPDRDKLIETITQGQFDKYEDVFKKLA